MKRVVIIGSGGVAEALAKGVSECDDLQLVQIFGRNVERTEHLSQITKTSIFVELQVADIYIVAVSDKAIAEVSGGLKFPLNAIVVHTAGSVAMGEILHPKRGVLYPLQSFTPGRAVDLSEVPFFVEGSSSDVEQVIEDVACALSRSVMHMDSEGRKMLHLCGVFVSNFTNAMYVVAADISQKYDISFELLKPLIKESCNKVLDNADPRLMQTGPAVRGDITTQQRHIEMLADESRLQEIYKILSLQIWETSKRM